MWQFLSHYIEIKTICQIVTTHNFSDTNNPKKLKKRQQDATLWTDDEYKRLKIQVLQAELRY